jgi:hypothetical protein
MRRSTVISSLSIGAISLAAASGGWAAATGSLTPADLPRLPSLSAARSAPASPRAASPRAGAAPGASLGPAARIAAAPLLVAPPSLAAHPVAAVSAGSLAAPVASLASPSLSVASALPAASLVARAAGGLAAPGSSLGSIASSLPTPSAAASAASPSSSAASGAAQVLPLAAPGGSAGALGAGGVGEAADGDEAVDVAEVDGGPEPVEGPALLATLKETWVYAAPSFKARKLGYLRAGARVSRDEKPVGRGSCEGGWYHVAPKGFVCVGMSASLNVDHVVAQIAARRPDRRAGLPYAYGMSRFPTPPFYLKLPSAEEQRQVEPDLAAHLARVAAAAKKPGPVAEGGPDPDLGDVPGALLYGGIVPSLTPNHHGPGALYAGRAVPRSGFAMVSQFGYGGRRWGLTTDLHVVPLDRMRPVTPSAFHGVSLAEAGLPAAFVRAKAARYLRRDERTGAMTDDGAIGYRDSVLLTGKSQRTGGVAYLEARDGRWVREAAGLVRIDAPKEWPSFATEGRKWIDVSILRQTLVAYEGKRPVYATLVSTGADGLGDPEKTHSTIRGVFLVHTKHVTVTMDSDEAEDRFDLRDVPYVQYFHEGYALHAAYWHDDFGRPRSHGCINLHPTDAAWLFGWTDPKVPDAWHAALSPRAGTHVYIHPLGRGRSLGGCRRGWRCRAGRCPCTPGGSPLEELRRAFPASAMDLPVRPESRPAPEHSLAP